MINRNLHLELAFCECESSDTVVLQVLQVKPEYGCSHQCNAGDTTSHKFDSVEVRVKWRYALKYIEDGKKLWQKVASRS